MQVSSRGLRHCGLATAGCLAILGLGSEGWAQPVGARVEPLTASTTDANTPAANAVVLYSNKCTGTLIAPDIVITAGHCGHNGGEAGRWHPMPGSVRFGNDRTVPADGIRVTHYNLVGNDDMMLLALASSIPATTAVPARVLLASPLKPEEWKTQSFVMVGWGQDASGRPVSTRQRANAGTGIHPFTGGGVTQPNMIGVSGVGGAQVLPGDSGGPLFWTDPSGTQYLIGVAQGTEPTGARHVVTFGVGGKDSKGAAKPNIADWIKKALESSACAQIAAESAGDRLVPLRWWRNAARKESFASTGAQCAMKKAGWSYVGDLEGRVFGPRFPRPPGTVPLYLKKTRSGDRFLSTDLAEGLFVSLEGYIYPRNAGSGAGRVGLSDCHGYSEGERFVMAGTSRPPWLELRATFRCDLLGYLLAPKSTAPF